MADWDPPSADEWSAYSKPRSATISIGFCLDSVSFRFIWHVTNEFDEHSFGILLAGMLVGFGYIGNSSYQHQKQSPPPPPNSTRIPIACKAGSMHTVRAHNVTGIFWKKEIGIFSKCVRSPLSCSLRHARRKPNKHRLHNMLHAAGGKKRILPHIPNGSQHISNIKTFLLNFLIVLKSRQEMYVCVCERTWAQFQRMPRERDSDRMKRQESGTERMAQKNYMCSPLCVL